MGICNSIQHDVYYFADTNYDCGPRIIEFDTSIWERWRESLSSLVYLYRPYMQIVLRRVHYVTRRSDPRWKQGRWRAKT